MVTNAMVEVACPACGATNRVPRARAGDDPKCGHCKAGLWPRHVVEAGEHDFSREVEASPLPVLVDFWAPWCGPCRLVAPVLKQIASEHGGKVKIVSINVDEAPGLATRFEVSSIPAMKVFADGRVVDAWVGALSKALIEQRLARALSR